MLKMLQTMRDELNASHRVDFKKAVSALGLNLAMCMIFGRHCGGKVVPKEVETLVLTFKRVRSFQRLDTLNSVVFMHPTNFFRSRNVY